MKTEITPADAHAPYEEVCDQIMTGIEAFSVYYDIVQERPDFAHPVVERMLAAMRRGIDLHFEAQLADEDEDETQ